MKFSYLKITVMLIHTNELVGIKHSTDLQIFAKTQQRFNTSKYVKLLQRFLNHNCSIHGICYLCETQSRCWIRSFWLIILTTAVFGCALMYSQLSARHNQQQLKTVVATSQLPIYNIEFPAVALCPWGQINWLRQNAAEERFLPSRSNESIKAAFKTLLLGFESTNPSRLDNLALLKNLTNLPAALDRIDLSELMMFLAYRCDEIFVYCKFDDTEIDCCKLFVSERTEKGVCLVFNSMVSMESRTKKVTCMHLYVHLIF